MYQLIKKHKRLITVVQQKTGLSDYQILWLSFIKGVIIGIVITVIIM